jgi:predicted HNH restriction endonuclease
MRSSSSSCSRMRRSVSSKRTRVFRIHHVKPLSEHEGEVDPASDLACLCANCHRMAHRRRTSVTSVDELRIRIEEANG